MTHIEDKTHKACMGNFNDMYHAVMQYDPEEAISVIAIFNDEMYQQVDFLVWDVTREANL